MKTLIFQKSIVEETITCFKGIGNVKDRIITGRTSYQEISALIISLEKPLNIA